RGLCRWWRSPIPRGSFLDTYQSWKERAFTKYGSREYQIHQTAGCGDLFRTGSGTQANVEVQRVQMRLYYSIAFDRTQSSTLNATNVLLSIVVASSRNRESN